MGSLPGSFRGRLVAIAALALGVRVLYTVLVGRHTDGIGDFFYYQGIANLLADGRGFVDPFLSSPEQSYPSALHPPLWSLALAVPSTLGATSILAHRLIGTLAGTATVVLLGLIGRRVAGERAGLLAAGIAAVYPTLIAADGSLMSETLYGTFVGAALLLSLRQLQRPAVAVVAALGAVIGLAALTRGEGVLFLPLLALPVAWRGGRPGRLTRLGVTVAATVLVIAPWTIRNWITFDQPVLVSTNEATVVAGANCDAVYGGRDLGSWSLGCISERRLGLNEAEQAEIWRDEGQGYARDHTRRLLAPVIGVRLLRTFDLWDPWAQATAAEGRSLAFTRAGILVWYLLLPLAAFGIFVLRRRRGPLLVLLAPFAVVIVSTALSFGLPRFRHAAELAVVVLAAVAVDRLLARRERATAPPERQAAAALSG